MFADQTFEEAVSSQLGSVPLILVVMDGMATPPAIPVRNRQHRRQSVPAPSTQSKPNDSNRVQVQPASPEVISSLITSLAIISSPANELFEQADEVSPLATAPRNTYGFSVGGSKRGSFGIDYGAFKQPSLNDDEEGPLDELAASPPVIRTAKPPSGFSPLTAPRSPTKDGSFKSFLRASSRPSSKGSIYSREHDEASSIGSLSIEPGNAPSELRKMPSSDSWGKKQGRNSKGLMYMSSKERLRDTERKRANVAQGAAVKGHGLERISTLPADGDTFLAERPITEEKEPVKDKSDPSSSTGTKSPLASSPKIGSASPAQSSVSQGGFVSQRHIPARDSSLRRHSTTTNKRSSNRSSRQSEKLREEEGDTIKEIDEQGKGRRDRSAEKRYNDNLELPADPIPKMLQPLRSPPSPEPLQASTRASKQVAESAKVEQRLLVDEGEEEGAPSPAIAQRKARMNADLEGSVVRNKIIGRKTPEPLDAKLSKRDSQSKRLSAPLSPTGDMKEAHHRSASQPLSRREMTSPEPAKSPKVNDDRPSSADSIDDAVDSYLCSPRLSQTIRHPQTGRVISFSEVGDPEGYAVFCCVGMGLTRYITAFYDELALTLKLRLITPDRPGVGESEAYTDGTATPLSWPGKVSAISFRMVS